MGIGITWEDVLVSEERAAEAALAMFKALGWNVLWQEADGNDVTPVLAAVPYDGALLAVTLNPDFAARCGYIAMPVDMMRPEATGEIERGGKCALDEIRFHATVHGGISFSSMVDDDSLEGIDMDGTPLAVIGFDCLHIGDGTDAKVARELGLPYTQAHPREGSRSLPSSLALVGHPWTDEEVLAECRHLANQLIVQQVA